MRKKKQPVISSSDEEYYDENAALSATTLNIATHLINENCEDWLGAFSNVTLGGNVKKNVSASSWIDRAALLGTDREIWLLYKRSQTVHRPCFHETEDENGIPRNCEYPLNFSSKEISEYLAVLCLEASLEHCLYGRDYSGGSTIAVHAFSRSPWTSPYIAALWLELRLQRLSDALGGVHEYLIWVHELDTPLQRVLRNLGWYAESYSEKYQNIGFSKLLLLRPRSSLPAIGKATR